MAESYVLSNAMPSLIGGVILFVFSFICNKLDRSLIAPATLFSLTWAVTLFCTAITPLLGFYYLENNVVVLFVLGAILFSLTSLLVRYLFFIFSSNIIFEVRQVDNINFPSVLLFFNVIGVVAYPLLFLDILSYGDNFEQIAYNLRVASVEGDQTTSAFVSNYLVFGFFCSIIFVYAIAKKKLKTTHVVISLTPFFLGSLILGGRAGLTTLLVSCFFVFVLASNYIKIKWIINIVLLMVTMLYFGAVLVNKFDVEDVTLVDKVILLLEHIMGYLFQGPILFSEYFNKSIMVRENWDTLNSMCHILSKVGYCDPLPLHADFANYGSSHEGNVYSLYFSLYPHYSYMGTAFFLVFYSLIITVFYERARVGHVFSLVVSAFMFSSIILSIYSDLIGYSLWQLIKFYIFSLFVVFFFSKPTEDY